MLDYKGILLIWGSGILLGWLLARRHYLKLMANTVTRFHYKEKENNDY